MILSKCFDVEILPNFFSITFIDLRDYLRVFSDCVEINKKGKAAPVPLVEKLTVSEIKSRLDTVKYDAFYITDKDDSQLFPLVSYLQNMYPRGDSDEKTRTDCFGYNSKSYDNLMVAAFLANVNRFSTTKELIRNLYAISKRIIASQNDYTYNKNDFVINTLHKFKLPYQGIDVMKIFALNKAGVVVDKNTGERKPIPKGLKQVSINLKWYDLLEYELPPICEKDFHFYEDFETTDGFHYKGMTISQLNKVVDKWDRFMIDEYIPPMMYYNKNDVFIVAEIVRLFPDEIKLRYSLTNVYKVNVLNSSRSNIADILFEKFYSEFTGLHPSKWKGQTTVRTAMAFKKVIFDFIQFKTPELQKMLEEMKKVVVYRTSKNDFEKVITINKLKYTIATGGLHSQDPPRALYSKHKYATSSTGGENDQVLTPDSYTFVHWDIASFYPSIMAVYQIAPNHMIKEIFAKLVMWIKTTRIDAKHSKEDLIDGIPPYLLAEALKIVINSIYGKFGFEKGDLFDRLATLKVTINGQLMIIMLCEELELNGIEVISANTDGIVVKLYERDRVKFNEIADKWKALTKLDADSEEYRCYINRDINNYIIQELNGKIDYKGAFNPRMYLKDLSKGYDMPVVAKAVENYFIYNISVMDTLTKCTDIFDFCKTQNVGKQWHVETTYVQNGVIVNNIMQRYVRFYVSNTGVVLEKVHNEIKGKGSRSRLASGNVVTVINTLNDKDISLRNINYRYYYAEVMKIIDPIKLNIDSKGKGKSKIKKRSSMYNDIFNESCYE